MTVVVASGSAGTRAIATRYPVEEGLVAGTTSQTGNKESLIAKDGTIVPLRKRVGLD
jgi:hypothetical protein